MNNGIIAEPPKPAREDWAIDEPKFQAEFTLDGAVYTAAMEQEACHKMHDESGFRDRLIIRLDGQDVTWKRMGEPGIPDDIQVGDTLLHFHMGKIKKVQAERVLKTQVTAGGLRYLRSCGREVGEGKWEICPHSISGYDPHYFATKKARAMMAEQEREQRRKELTSQIVDACKTADLRSVERALRELS